MPHNLILMIRLLDHMPALGGLSCLEIECAVRNISDTGAALEVSTTFGIPSNFDLIIDGVRRHCQSVWRTETKIGIMFH
jgi:hypothetical protein